MRSEKPVRDSREPSERMPTSGRFNHERRISGRRIREHRAGWIGSYVEKRTVGGGIRDFRVLIDDCGFLVVVARSGLHRGARSGGSVLAMFRKCPRGELCNSLHWAELPSILHGLVSGAPVDVRHAMEQEQQSVTGVMT